MTTVYEKLKRAIVDWEGINEEDVHPEASLVDDLHIDSLGLVDLVMHLEDEFNISIPSQDIQSIDTVRDAQEYLEKRLTSGNKKQKTRQSNSN